MGNAVASAAVAAAAEVEEVESAETTTPFPTMPMQNGAPQPHSAQEKLHLDPKHQKNRVQLEFGTTTCHHEFDDNPSIMAFETDRESKIVARFRLLVLVVLVVSMAATATAVYRVTRGAEQDAFRASFTNDSNDIMESVAETLYTSLGAVDAYIVSVISLARATNQSWPFVSVPNASVRLAKLRSLSKAVSVMQAHFVSAAQKETWENYTTTHNQWAFDALENQKTDKNYHGKQYDSFVHKPWIRSHKGNSTGDGPFLPSWHSSPFLPDVAPYGVDGMVYRNLREVLPEVLDPKRVVICRVNNIANQSDPVSVEETQASYNYWKNVVPPGDDPNEPISWMLVPMVDDVADHISHEHDETGLSNPDRKVVGVTLLFIFCRDLIRNIVSSSGVMVVIENGCGQVFSYELNGEQTTYLGPTDEHDARFDDMRESIAFDQLAQKSTTGVQYSGPPLGGEICPYTLSVYPSLKLQSSFTHRQPAILTACAALIFVFTSAIFILYDTCGQRRQRKIVYAAAESRANVSVLERMVSDRTQSLEDTNRRLEEANRRVTKAYESQLEHFACMSHEIRTPLNCVIGLSSLLLDSELEPMQGESVRMIVTSGDLLLTVVNDVLDFAKLESGNVDIVPVKSNLQHTLNAVLQSIETKALPKKLVFRTVFDPLIGEYMYTDHRRLQQILYNLLGNAVKFSHEGGTIQLSISLLAGNAARVAFLEHEADTSESEEVFRSETMVVCQRPTEAVSDSFTITSLRGSNTSSATHDSLIRLSVRDSGKGIERKDFKTIFQPFRQASAEAESVHGGTGLGLAVTARLAAAMGGTISVDSRVGEWTNFTVDLPYADSPVNVEQLADRLKSTRVVLIDDNVNNVEAVSRIMREFCLECFCYRTIAEVAACIGSLEATLPKQTYICVVNERMYTAEGYRSLQAVARCVLLTFGPTYAVKESRGHDRSLTSILPSVLIDSFASAVDSLATSLVSPRVRRKLVTGNPAESLRILIAEDNVINQKVLLKILEKLYYKNVEVVGDGKQAYEREFLIPYDVILMDIQMPVLDGIDACKTILGRTGNHPKPKIIFITAHVSDAYETACRAAGGVDFLAKPVNLSDVDDCLRRNMPMLSVKPLLVEASPALEVLPNAKVPTTPRAPPLDSVGSGGTGATAKVGESLTANPKKQLRILVAEDNKINQKVLIRILDRLDYINVDVVDDGQQACDKERLTAYDVILMDVQMPVMDGIAACREILGRSSPHAVKPKVIFVTAHVSDAYEAECRAAGGVDFVAKPVNMVDIDNCLRRHAPTVVVPTT